MRGSVVGLFLLGLLLLPGCAATESLPAGEQVPQTFERAVPMRGQYLVYLPEGYDEGGRFPLLLFLHGSGERGEDIDLVKVHGPPKLAARGDEFPFIVVSPQMPKNQRWSPALLDAVLDEALDRYRVDEARMYVTGLSMGGEGTWLLALQHPHRFAAIAPVCGPAPFTDVCALKDLPVWVFHGAKDTVVPLKESERMVEALKQCDGDVRFTVYPEAGHDAWTETYDNPELYTWLLQHRRTGPGE